MHNWWVKQYKIIITSPKEIDDALNDENLNLNWLEAIKAADIINELKPEKVILDAPSNNIKAYTDYTKKLLKTKTILKAEHKATQPG